MKVTATPCSRRIDPGEVLAGFFAHSGLARLSRYWRPSSACILTFHGVRDGSHDDQLLDVNQHVHVSLFEELCRFLAANYTVLPLSEVVAAKKKGRSLPQRTVAITFDDGYASNYHLAYPILKSLNLPATIFSVAGYLDGKVTMWFHRIEMAFARTEAPFIDFPMDGHPMRFGLADREHRAFALGVITGIVKKLPTTELLIALAKIERDLGVTDQVGKNLPVPLQPMSWDMARELDSGGLIDIGGHTFTHPILARCSDDQQAEEIKRSRDRLTAELGRQPKLFAYTNGKTGDFTTTTQRLLREHGFEAAVTMQEAFVFGEDDDMALPRYGCPPSTGFLDATVSGCLWRFESLRKYLGFGRQR